MSTMTAAGDCENQRWVLVLVDAHRGLGLPLCSRELLCNALLTELCEKATQEALRSPWKLFGSGAAKQKEELKARAVAETKNVLSGARRPPGGLMRAVDVVARDLCQGMSSRRVHCRCLLFGDSSTEMRSPVSAAEIPASWDAAGGTSGLPDLSEIRAAGTLQGTAAVVVITTRVNVSAAPLLREDEDGQDAPPLFWVVCCAADAFLGGFFQIEQLCDAAGGAASVAKDDQSLGKALRLALRTAAPKMQNADAQGTTSDGTFEVVWTEPGTLGLDFAPFDSKSKWVVSKSTRSEIRPGDILTRAQQSPVSGSGAVSIDIVVSMLRDQRPLTLTFTRGAPAGNVRKELTDADVAQAVLARESQSLARLSPEQRRTRIRELVAQEFQTQRIAESSKFVHILISKVLNESRPVEQRVLIEWLLCLGRCIAFCGDAITLARAGMVSQKWSSSLQPKGSALARSLWKWMVRFGEPLPHRFRWRFWQWLQSKPLLRHKGAKLSDTSGRDDRFFAMVERGRTDERLSDSRAVIAADVPRTFAALEAAMQCARMRSASTELESSLTEASTTESSASETLLLPYGCAIAADDLNRRRKILENVLLALAAEHPSIGYCQGLDVIVAFVISVVEEAGFACDAIEFESFSFVAGLLEVPFVRSWLEPPLNGLRNAGKTLEHLLSERHPKLTAHLQSEGAGLELLSLSWFQTLFVGFSALPRSTMCRAWECCLLDGTPKVFFRLALGILSQVEEALRKMTLERIAEILRVFPPPFDRGLVAARLIPDAWAIKVTNSGLQHAFALAEAEAQKQRSALVFSQMPAPESLPCKQGYATSESDRSGEPSILTSQQQSKVAQQGSVSSVQPSTLAAQQQCSVSDSTATASPELSCSGPGSVPSMAVSQQQSELAQQSVVSSIQPNTRTAQQQCLVIGSQAPTTAELSCSKSASEGGGPRVVEVSGTANASKQMLPSEVKSEQTSNKVIPSKVSGSPGTSSSPNKAGFDVSDPQLEDMWNKVIDDEDSTKWIVLGYGSRNGLSCIASGAGGCSELLAFIQDSDVYWAGFRAKSGKLHRLFYIGTSVEGVARARAAIHKRPGLTVFKGSVADTADAHDLAELRSSLEKLDF